MPARYHVYLRRTSLESADPRALAAACGASRADIDRVLKSKIPQAVLVEETPEAADAAVAGLRERGIDAFRISPDDLRAFRPRPILRLPPESAQMIVVGRIHTESRTTTRSGLDPYAGAGVGYAVTGFPMMARSLVDREQVSVRKDEESFCCLFKNREHAMLILERSFDYRAVLGSLEPTTERNFRRVVEMARTANRDAHYDERLYRYPAAVRLLGGRGRSSGSIVTVAQQVEEGSTGERAMSAALLIYMEAFGTE